MPANMARGLQFEWLKQVKKKIILDHKLHFFLVSIFLLFLMCKLNTHPTLKTLQAFFPPQSIYYRCTSRLFNHNHLQDFTKNSRLYSLNLQVNPLSPNSWFSLSRHKILKSKPIDERSQEFVML